jgi:hypothetical protein
MAGYVPRSDLPALDASLAGAAPGMPAEFVALVRRVLEPRHKDVLLEFLAQMQARGIAMPAHLLPEILDLADADIRHGLVPLLGDRGRWLSRHNPAWSWAHASTVDAGIVAPEALRRVWDTGSIRERVEVLARLRRSDPAAARDWAAATLERETAEHRAGLLAAFADDPTPDDEPFLESCLGDRSFTVRQAAAALLARVPASALAVRMRERADAMLAAGQRGARGRSLSLTCHPPEQVDKRWERDGIPAKAPAGTGLRAVRAELVLAHVPPSHWTARFATTPERLIDALHGDPFEQAAMCGLTQASCRFAGSDPETAGWLGPCTAYWTACLTRASEIAPREILAHLDALLRRLPQPEAEQAMIRILDLPALPGGLEPLHLIAVLPRPWSVSFGRAYMQHAREAVQHASADRAVRWAVTLPAAARALPRDLFAAALDAWGDSEVRAQPIVHREADGFIELVRLRHRFHELLSQGPWRE